MKNCPKCRVETRCDAEWCWFCGYAFEDEPTDAQPPARDDTPAEAPLPASHKDLDA
jgi:hypothetical protein